MLIRDSEAVRIYVLNRLTRELYVCVCYLYEYMCEEADAIVDKNHQKQ